MDTVFGFLFLQNILSFKINQIFRLLFIIYYAHYTNMVFSSFFQFCWKIRKIFFFIFVLISFTGMLLFVLYFDAASSHNDTFFNRMDFSTVISSIYTSYTIFTFENTLNIINFTLIKNPIYLIFLIPMFFCTLFLISSFVISMFCTIYVFTIQKNIKSLPHYY